MCLCALEACCYGDFKDILLFVATHGAKWFWCDVCKHNDKGHQTPTGHVTPVMSKISNYLSMEIKSGKLPENGVLGQCQLAFIPAIFIFLAQIFITFLVTKYVNNLS